MQQFFFDGKGWVPGTPAGGEPSWIRAGGSTEPELHELAKTYGLHPLTIEDVCNVRQRPKVEDYDDMTFTILRVPRGDEMEDGWQQVGVWLLPNLVITASPSPVPELDAVEARLRKRGNTAKSVDRVWFNIHDALVDSWFPFMEALEEEGEDIEEAALERADQETLAKIRDSKGAASRIRKLVVPMRDAMLQLERNDHPNVPAELRVYLRDLSDHTTRIVERLEHVRELAWIAQETWNSTLANQQNKEMKRLTVIAALLLVPGLLAGLGGMNFAGIPDWNYWTVTFSILGLVAAGVTLAIWRRWL